MSNNVPKPPVEPEISHKDDEEKEAEGATTVRGPRPDMPTKPSPAALAASRREPTDRPEYNIHDTIHSPPPPPPGSPTSGDKILVIDDDIAILDALGDILGDEGYRVWRARDGIEGLRRLFEMPRVDLILLDLMMPRASGTDFLEVFDKTPFSDVPVVVISAFKPPSFAPYDDRFVFMGKPLNLDALLTTVRHNIEHSRRYRKEDEDRE